MALDHADRREDTVRLSRAAPAPAGPGTVERPAVTRTPRWSGWAIDLAVVVAAGATIALHVRNAFFFSNDDILQLGVADQSGLSRELLGLNVFGHFGPVNRLGHLIFLRWMHLDLTAGVVAVTLLAVALILALLWCCRELRLPPLRRALVVGGVGFSAALLDTVVWMDAALHIIPALVATYAVLGAHLRGLNTGRNRWHVVSVVVFALGLLTQERVGLALPLVVLVDVLLVDAGRPWRDRLGTLRRTAVPLAGMAVLGAAMARFLMTNYVSPDGQGPPLDVLAQTIGATLTGALFPGLMGWLPAELPPPVVQVAVAAVALGASVVLVRRRRANGAALLFALLAFGLYYGLMAFSPILNADTVAANVLRMHNLVYVIVPVLLGLVHLRSSRDGAPRRTNTGVRQWGPPVGVTVALLALVVTGSMWTAQNWDRARAGHAYETAVAAGEPEWTRDDTTVLPVKSPEPVAGSWVEEWGRHEILLPMYRPGWTAGASRDRLVVLDPSGVVSPVTVRQEARGQLPVDTPGARACVQSSPGSQRLTVPLDRPVVGEPLFMQVTYELAGSVPIEATGLSWDAQGSWAAASWAVELPAGQHTVFLPLRSADVVQVALDDVTVGASLCVSDLSVVRPLYEVDGTCYLMDEYAVRGARAECPVGRPTG